MQCRSEIILAAVSLNTEFCRAAPDSALAEKGIGQSDLVDNGQTCWDAPAIFFFVRNECDNPIRATIKVHSGSCADFWGQLFWVLGRSWDKHRTFLRPFRARACIAPAGSLPAVLHHEPDFHQLAL